MFFECKASVSHLGAKLGPLGSEWGIEPSNKKLRVTLLLVTASAPAVVMKAINLVAEVVGGSSNELKASPKARYEMVKRVM